MTAAAHKAEGLWEPRKLGTCHARICAPCRRRAYARAALGQCTELTRENAWAWMCLPAPARAPYVNEHFLRIKPLLILLLAEFDETLHARFTRLCFDMRAYIGTLDTNVQCVGIEAKGSETRRNASITCCCAGQPQSYPKHPAPNLRGPAALWTPSRQHRARRSAVAHKGLLRGARSFARPSWGPGRVFGRSCSLCLACTTGRASRNRRCVRDSTETAQWMCRGACRLSNGQIGAGTSSSGLLIVRTMGRNRRKAGATCEDWRGRFVQGPSRRIVLPAFRVRGRRHARSRRKRMERTATHRAARGADRRGADACLCRPRSGRKLRWHVRSAAAAHGSDTTAVANTLDAAGPYTADCPKQRRRAAAGTVWPRSHLAGSFVVADCLRRKGGGGAVPSLVLGWHEMPLTMQAAFLSVGVEPVEFRRLCEQDWCREWNGWQRVKQDMNDAEVLAWMEHFLRLSTQDATSTVGCVSNEQRLAALAEENLHLCRASSEGCNCLIDSLTIALAAAGFVPRTLLDDPKARLAGCRYCREQLVHSDDPTLRPRWRGASGEVQKVSEHDHANAYLQPEIHGPVY
eukprot:s6410_g11.t1